MTGRTRLALALVLSLATISFAASAASSEEYSTLDKQSGDMIKAAVDFNYLIDNGDPEGPDGTHVNLYGQGSFGGIGGYIQLPLSTVIPDEGDSVTAIHGLEIGALYDLSLMDILGLTLRLGIVTPTASVSDDDNQVVSSEAVARGLGTQARVTDFAQAFPQTSLRISGSPRIDLGIAYIKADAGVDTIFGSDEREALPDTEAVARLNVGGGVTFGFIGLQAESANTIALTDGILEQDGSLNTLNFSITSSLPFVDLMLGSTFPMHDATRGELYIVSLGAALKL